MRLTCNEKGDFTILIIGDPQLDWPEIEPEGPAEIRILLDRVHPDFVLMNGDLKTRNDYDEAYLDNIVAPINERNIPWAYTNGNHDRFTAEHHAWCKSYPNCLGDVVPSDDPDHEPERPLNYVLPVFSRDKSKAVFAIWGMDTGMYNQFGWEGLTAKQIRWYQRNSDALTVANGAPVPGLLCCHIPFPQMVDLYYSKKEGGAAEPGERGDAYLGNGSVSLALGEENYVTDTGTKILGATGFACTTRANDRGMLDAIIKQGDIKMAVFAHEHTKNFVGHYKGLLMGYAGKISMGCGYNDLTRGGRVVQLNENAPDRFVTFWVGSMETSKDQPAIYQDGTLA